MAGSPNSPSKVFISYSHRDKAYLDRLQAHLKPHVRAGTIPLWVDTDLKPGDDWKAEIKRALESAQVAILLVSVSFLASDFVAEEELPKLLAAAEERGARILPIILTPCSFHRTKLRRFQAVNDPTKPLSALKEYEQDMVWVELVDAVLEALETGPEPKPAQPTPAASAPYLGPTYEVNTINKQTDEQKKSWLRDIEKRYRFLVGEQNTNKGVPLVKVLYVNTVENESDEAMIASAKQTVDLSGYQNLRILTKHQATKHHWRQVRAYFDTIGWNNHPLSRLWVELTEAKTQQTVTESAIPNHLD